MNTYDKHTNFYLLIIRFILRFFFVQSFTRIKKRTEMFSVVLKITLVYKARGFGSIQITVEVIINTRYDFYVRLKFITS